MPPMHEPQFYTSSERGSFAACRCGWEMQVPDVTVPAFRVAVVGEAIFQAAFDVGRAYEQHIQGDQ